MKNKIILQSRNWQKDLKYCEMIKDRGIAAYSGMLGFNIPKYAEKSVKENGSFKWIDMCCGYFDAGRDLTYNLFQNRKNDVISKIETIGVDADTFMGDSSVRVGMKAKVHRGNAVDYVLPEKVDLVTCLRGLRYIEEYLGQGALAIQNWFNQLPQNGILLFDTYYNNGGPKEHEDNPVIAGNIELTKALVQRLGNSVKTYRTNYRGINSFVVKIKKQKPEGINLFD